MITDVNTKKNVEQINGNQFTMFNAGKLAKEYKQRLYMDRYPELIKKGYVFIPGIFESSGGINSELRNVLNYFIYKKAKMNKKEFGVMAHNYYIELSIFYQRLRYESLWDHYKLL